MDRSSRQPGDVFAGEARSELSPRAVRALWWGSAGLVLAVPGTAVLVAGAERGWRLFVAVALVLVQVCALRRQVRAPVAVLAVNAATGIAVWTLLPAVSLTGALLAAQVTLCVLSATRPRRASVRALAAMCLPVPLAFGAGGGPTGVAVCLLAVVLAWTVGQWRRAQQARAAAEMRQAVVEERARIAREVHDVVAHTLSVMLIQAGAADDVFAERPDQARQALRAIETGARSALGELRLLLQAFGPEPGEAEAAGGGGAAREQLEPGPSLARLDELADPVRATGMTVSVHREGAFDGLPAVVDLAAYRIVQEALTNTLRHAVGADEVGVCVTVEGECVKISVVDNGRAPQGRSDAAGAGRGLVGMKERARLVGGSLRAGPLPQGGFEVAARLPVERVS
ncbi:sensor histidine kinase [Streptomyces sp. NPDC051554]|uniref:sensor histidine kinase n=1 Tax=Streptomyces sp. NPDC051554 TaxID=3365656 RepID=UPI0037B18280